MHGFVMSSDTTPEAWDVAGNLLYGPVVIFGIFMLCQFAQSYPNCSDGHTLRSIHNYYDGSTATDISEYLDNPCNYQAVHQQSKTFNEESKVQDKIQVSPM